MRAIDNINKKGKKIRDIKTWRVIPPSLSHFYDPLKLQRILPSLKFDILSIPPFLKLLLLLMFLSMRAINNINKKGKIRDIKT